MAGTGIGFENFQKQITVETENLQQKATQLRAELSEVESRLEKLQAARAALEGRSVKGVSKTGRQSHLSPERAKLRSKIAALVQERRWAKGATAKKEAGKKLEAAQAEMAALKAKEKA